MRSSRQYQSGSLIIKDLINYYFYNSTCSQLFELFRIFEHRGGVMEVTFNIDPYFVILVVLFFSPEFARVREVIATLILLAVLQQKFNNTKRIKDEKET